jgi:hypothetical protein
VGDLLGSEEVEPGARHHSGFKEGYGQVVVKDIDCISGQDEIVGYLSANIVWSELDEVLNWYLEGPREVMQ